MRRVFPLAVLVLALAFTFACNDDDDNGNPAGPGGDELSLPATPTELITVYFPAVYSEGDSAAYEAILDSAYVFELLPDEVDPSDPNPWWDRREELGIAGNMFNGRFNEAGQRVDRIILGLTERSNVVDNTAYPDKPSGEEWRKVTALVDLLVVCEDPVDAEGVINFIVNSNQIFTVRPARDDGSTWTVYKQVDQEPIN